MSNREGSQARDVPMIGVAGGSEFQTDPLPGHWKTIQAGTRKHSRARQSEQGLET